jgi:hypothetical protein
MPLHHVRERAHVVRYELRAGHRAEILEAMEGLLIAMCSLAAAAPFIGLFIDDDMPEGLMVYMNLAQGWMLCMNGALRTLQYLMQCYYQRRRLGAESSGAMLTGNDRGMRGPPLSLTEWDDCQCVKRTRFTVAQVRTLLRGFQLVDDHDNPLRFRIYQSAHLCRKRRSDGSRRPARNAKYFYVHSDTALLVVLVYLSSNLRYCDMQPVFNGMPSPEMSLVVDFMLAYLAPWSEASGHVLRKTGARRLANLIRV